MRAAAGETFALCALIALAPSCRTKSERASAPPVDASRVATTDAAVVEPRADTPPTIGDDPDECRRVADAAARSLPAVARAIDALEKSTRDPAAGAALGGVDFGASDEDLLSWGIGVHTRERYEGAIWCSVSRQGDLSVNVYGEDVPIPAALQERVRRGCRSQKNPP